MVSFTSIQGSRLQIKDFCRMLNFRRLLVLHWRTSICTNGAIVGHLPEMILVCLHSREWLCIFFFICAAILGYTHTHIHLTLANGGPFQFEAKGKKKPLYWRFLSFCLGKTQLALENLPLCQTLCFQVKHTVRLLETVLLLTLYIFQNMRHFF